MERNQINLDSVHIKLIKIFKDKFHLDDVDVFDANIKTVETWDSFSHMDLMIELQFEFKLKELSGEDFSALTSFKKIYDYISQGR
ncbi:acyl carrier protein [Polynucleobacter sp. IMCC 29146]|uniref:acyl carrier protein n=1 Tax=Polynucleobacter sp. IMCC 29146 TaxID=2780953 RepID=UPI001F1F7F16|nr:acyl carrier protein [Polynucleobacter sp. IMCC 29146]MCE7530646.1 acyl carrier protein [Polynucleobacter sp. IMCC 29146]